MSKIGDRGRVIRENYRLAKEHDPKLGWVLLGLFVGIIAVFVAIGIWTSNPITWIIIGVSLALAVTAIIFSRRAMRSAYRSIEGQPGAAVAVVQQMAKAGWGITAGVAANRQQDLVHRAVGRPGVVLIGEGRSPALAGLMTAERKRTARFVGEVPIHELVVGQEDGQVPIARLDKHLRKMPKVLAPGEVTTLRKRLEALASQPVPIPKGPIPKTGRMPRGGKLR
jgi:hypothetical protein